MNTTVFMPQTSIARQQRHVRQGDVLIIEEASHNPTVEAPEQDPRGAVLAEGETSHHHHVVMGGNARVFRFRSVTSDRLVRLDENATVRVIGGGSGRGAGEVVNRHYDIPLPAGTHVRRLQREWSVAMQRAVRGAD